MGIRFSTHTCCSDQKSENMSEKSFIWCGNELGGRERRAAKQTGDDFWLLLHSPEKF